MRFLGEQTVHDLYQAKQKLQNKTVLEEIPPSRFIIHPKNFRKMWWDNFLLIATIIYLFQLPLYVCHDKYLTWRNFFLLSNFDFIFIIDSIINLFIGFYDKDGEYEPKIVVVILKNFLYGTILELFYYLAPLFLGI